MLKKIKLSEIDLHQYAGQLWAVTPFEEAVVAEKSNLDPNRLSAPCCCCEEETFITIDEDVLCPLCAVMLLHYDVIYVYRLNSPEHKNKFDKVLAGQEFDRYYEVYIKPFMRGVAFAYKYGFSPDIWNGTIKREAEE